MKLHNKPELKFRRKILRNLGTQAEASLWLMLKGKQVEGRKFRRQHSVGHFILDFYCPSEHLAIELDGEQHFTEDGKKRDEMRAAYIESLGIKIIRFENFQVFDHPEMVIQEIKKHFNKTTLDAG